MAPIAVPRRIGPGRLAGNPPSRQQPADRLADDVAGLGMVEVAQDLGDAEHAHGEHGEIDAVGEEGEAEGHALLAGLEIGADGREQHAEEDHRDGLEDRAARQHDGEDEAHHHQREILRRAEDAARAGSAARRGRR